MIRAAVPADAADVAALESTCLGADAWPIGLVEDGLSGRVPTVAYLVVELDAEVVGHAVVSVVDGLAELQRIAVAPAHRRTGLGGDLLAAAVVHARTGGADRMLLEVREDNATALAFYDRHGFAELARRPRYYRDGTTAVVLGVDLAQPTSPVS